MAATAAKPMIKKRLTFDSNCMPSLIFFKRFRASFLLYLVLNLRQKILTLLSPLFFLLADAPFMFFSSYSDSDSYSEASYDCYISESGFAPVFMSFRFVVVVVRRPSLEPVLSESYRLLLEFEMGRDELLCSSFAAFDTRSEEVSPAPIVVTSFFLVDII